MAAGLRGQVCLGVLTSVGSKSLLSGCSGWNSSWLAIGFDLCETIIIMYINKLVINYSHAFINALSAHMIHINLNMIFYTHVDHSPTKRFT